LKDHVTGALTASVEGVNAAGWLNENFFVDCLKNSFAYQNKELIVFDSCEGEPGDISSAKLNDDDDDFSAFVSEINVLYCRRRSGRRFCS
jgi:hypothetical protein